MGAAVLVTGAAAGGGIAPPAEPEKEPDDAQRGAPAVTAAATTRPTATRSRAQPAAASTSTPRGRGRPPPPPSEQSKPETREPRREPRRRSHTARPATAPDSRRAARRRLGRRDPRGSGPLLAGALPGRAAGGVRRQADLRRAARRPDFPPPLEATQPRLAPQQLGGSASATWPSRPSARSAAQSEFQTASAVVSTAASNRSRMACESSRRKRKSAVGSSLRCGRRWAVEKASTYSPLALAAMLPAWPRPSAPRAASLRSFAPRAGRRWPAPRSPSRRPPAAPGRTP